MSELFFEDFTSGSVMEFSAREPVSKDAIIEFARQFDPQPFHLDEEAAKHSLLGTLCASGWHTCAMVMRLNYDGWISRTASLGSPGIDEVRWARPVRPGDLLHMRLTVGDTRASQSRPEMGLVAMSGEVTNGAGEIVMTQKHTQMIARRNGSPAESAVTKAQAAPTSEPNTASAQVAGDTGDENKPFAAYFEDIAVGATRDLGSEQVTKEAILAFAREFDPQPFHIDEEAARNSHFGALSAPGWLTAALWMRHTIATRDRVARERQAKGLSAPAGGPSPGFTKLRWIKPVHVGDTLSFASRVTSKRPTSKPGLGLVFSENSATNGRGERVFEFQGSGFTPLRPA